MTIKAKHPVREAFSECSTGNKRGCYYETKGHAVHSFNCALHAHDFKFDDNELIDFFASEGRKTLNVLTVDDEKAGIALITWYRMPSGRYEFTGYIA